MDDKDTERPAFNGVSCKASSMYLNAAEDFHLPSVPISCIGSIAPLLLLEWPVISLSMFSIHDVITLTFWTADPSLSGNSGVSSWMSVCSARIRCEKLQPRALQVTTAFQRLSDTMCSLVHLGLLNEQGDGPVEVVDCHVLHLQLHQFDAPKHPNGGPCVAPRASTRGAFA